LVSRIVLFFPLKYSVFAGEELSRKMALEP